TQNITITDNDVAITKISAIQGSGATAALTGTQTIEGIVTGAFLGATKLNGFYVQEEDADTDSNSATSEAIFVYDPSGLFTGNIGDKVRITGTVSEFTTTSGSNTSSLTQFSSLTSVVNLGAGTLPTAVNVQLPNSNLESYEGMLINLSAGSGNLTVTEYYQLGRYGQVVLSAMGSSNQPGTDARLDQYTQFNAPSVSGYATYLADIAARKIYLDDGSAVQNPDPIIFGRGGNPLSAINTLRGGDTVASITGILDQRYEGYRIQTTDGVNFTPGGGLGERPFAPTVGGTLRVASFNVLNYFNDLDTNVNINTNGLSFEPRGANTAIELTRQLNKIVQAIISSGADVLGLMELENNGYGANSAIQSLITGLNGVAGAGTYSFISSSTRLGTDAITVGLIYKSSQVTPYGAAATLPDSFGTGAYDLVGRKPLAQTFQQNSNGELFTAVVNHFKSKGSNAGGIGDTDAGDGQGLSNGTRTRQAQDLAAWLATKPTGVNDGDYLLLGDFNAYAQEDPLTTLAIAGYNNLLPNTFYSYVFDGQLGSLDHALATSSLAAQVSDVEIWHINADEPSVLDYNIEFKSINQITSLYSPDQFRASDHDPVIVGLNLNSAPTNITLTATSINENVPANSVVGTLATIDPNNSDTFTYSLVAGADNAAFTINSNQLLINTSPDFETQSSYSIVVRSTDQSGLYTDKVFTINVNNMNDPATINGNSILSITEGTNINAGKLTASGTLTVVDQDAGENKFATTVVSANGNLGSLTITETGAFSYSVNNSAVQYLNAGQSKVDTFTVTSLDGTASRNISITINGINPATTVDLSTYVRVGRYDLPEPTRTTAPTNSLLAQEVSAVTYNWDTDTLFVVGDGSTSIVQVSKTGQLINSMTLAPGNSPQGTDFYDIEGLTYIGNGKFVLIEERDRQANLFTYTPGSTLTKANTQTVKLGTTIDNIGIEGISWDPQSGGFIAVKEKQPAGIFQTTIDFAAGTASNGSPTTVNSINLFDPALANLLDFADVYALSNLSSLNGQPDYSRLLVLSQESGKIVSIDRSGNISSSLKIISDPGNPASVVDQQHEGLTMDKNGYLYVVSENGGGNISYPQLWVYAPSAIPNQAPTGLVLDNKVLAIAENTSTTAAIKIADITITDDGLGINTLSLSGADASFFEINDTAFYIKAGTTLDYETKTSYSVTINVDDATLGNNPDATANFTLAVTDIVNEIPTLPALIISEVSPWSSSNSVYTADWFEVTNIGTSAVDITGWKMDDNSNSSASSVSLNGVTSIAPGQSVIFLETATPDTTIPAFKTAWFGTNVPSNLTIGSYTGSGVGLSALGDAVNLFNANGTRITGVSFGGSTTYTTFDNAVGLGSTTLPLPTVSTISAVGVKGAFLSFNNALNVTSKEIGSPGRINNMNNLASISGNGNVTIKEGTNVNAGKLTASGTLTVTDEDAGENKFATTVVSANGNLGSLTITDTGAFSYSVDNSAVQYLTAGQTKIDTFTVTSFDGTATQNIAIAINGVTAGFTGVAAGDTTATSAILWTRTFDTANTTTQPGITQDVTLQLSTDANFTTIVRSISGVTRDANRDYTLKIDATGLQSGTKYYYRFQTTAGESSQVGTFRTAYEATTQAPVKFAFSGDADGVMRPYISTQNFPNLNLDFFMFLGDTIYETASTGSPAATTNIVGNPSQALIDYHRKYLENLRPVNNNGFSGLQGLYSSQGNYTALDNHELGNKQLINGGAPGALATASGNGSSNTVDDVNTTGVFINQNPGFKALIQAYSDYQPIRERIISAPTDLRTNGTQQLYLAQQWGKNVIHINTDTRSYRDVRLKTATGADDTGSRADNSDRTMLGDTQLAWLKQTLLDAQNNGTIWKFVSVSSPIDQIGAIGSGADGGKSWIGGYRAERNDLLKFIADNSIKNVVFLSADDHQNRINELTYTDNGVVKVLPNALSIVGGPVGATGPDTITNHSFANIQTLANNLANNQIAAGINPLGLDPNFPGLRNVWRENDTNPTQIEPVDFYSPDTFNYTVFDIAADGKTLNVNVQGVNSYAQNTFPEPSAANQVRSILSFSIDAAVPVFNFNLPNYSVAEGGTSGFSNATVRVTRQGDLSGTNSVQLQLNGGTANGSAAAPTVDTSKGPSSSATSYIIPTTPGSGVSLKSILTVGDWVNNKPDGTPYRMVGIPDGLGAYDNGDGTFTLLMNHEIGSTSGIVRAHGGTGAFVSKWVINKSDLSVVSGSDLTQTVYVWNSTNFAQSTTTAFSRFCSGDLAAVSAFYNSTTGLGSTARIYLNGEESGAEGRAFAHIATGTNAGTTYELPYLGKFSWENIVASPTLSNKTVVAGLDDSAGGQVYIYIGDKTNTGTDIDKAGLNNGKLYGIAVTGLTSETNTTNLAPGSRFTLADLGKVQNTTGAALQTQSVAAGVTAFLRPEDGHWDPSNPSDFYFVTTNSFSGPSRLWRLRFDNPTNPELGGTIEAVLDGTEGQKMFDNMTIDKYGHILLQEDVGNNAHIGKIWQYNIATDSLKLIAQHDPNRFLSGSPNFLTQDEESSGIIDAQDILGPGWFLLDTQAHYGIAGELVEGGQLQALFNPDTYKAYQTDYINSAITVTFAPGESYKDVQIPIAGDSVIESSETVNLSLVNPSSGTSLGTQQPTAVLTIADLNQAPTNLILSTSTVTENQTDGVIGNLTSTDPNTGNTFTYSLVTGDGDTDNDLFSIVDNQLIANTVFDFETQTSYSIRVQTTDQDGLSFEKALTINVNDINEAPTDLSYDNTTDTTAIDEGQPSGTVVGNLISTDPETGDTFTYSLVAGDGDTDNSAFTISGNQLQINASPDFETKSSYSIRVRTSDNDGLTFEKVLTINVNDLNEIIGNASNNNLVGTANNDYIDGKAGNDTLNGGAGVDILIGGMGNDTYIVDTTTDTIIENPGEGRDLVQSSVTYTLSENVENLT
ncbi:ExeM/NucH family extracellular endonuclease, partial [Dolichospermum circinale]|uniref:ExeM/NucH family extracellular endonuclease n=1 Tax=Dolichospermum circinale TaxID=109265 RepID=UPI001E4734DC